MIGRSRVRVFAGSTVIIISEGFGGFVPSHQAHCEILP
jgi:hypothetical protein